MFSGIAAILILASVMAPKVEVIGVSEELINGLPLSGPQCLAVNPSREEFLVADGLNNRVVIFDTLGRAVFDFPLGEDRANPFGIAVDSQEEIFVGAMDSPEIWSFDYDGRYLSTFYLPDGVFPGRMMAGPGDDLFVVDRAGAGIFGLSKTTGESRESFASQASPAKPSGLCLDSAGNMLLVSLEGTAVTAFEPAGKSQYTIGEHGRRPEDFSHPTSAIIDYDGNLWIIDSFRHHIKRFDKNHKFVDIVGVRGTGMGEFYFPVDLKLTPSSKLGVLEKGAGRLQIFRVGDDK